MIIRHSFTYDHAGVRRSYLDLPVPIAFWRRKSQDYVVGDLSCPVQFGETTIQKAQLTCSPIPNPNSTACAGEMKPLVIGP